MFRDLMGAVVRFVQREDGPTSVEYAIQLAIIASICIGSVGSMGHKANATFGTVSNQLGKTSGS